MANSFAQKIDIFFQDVVAGFEATNVTAKNVAKYKPSAGALQLTGQTYYRPMQLMVTTTDGRDVSSSAQDLTELVVPSTLTESHLRNVFVNFVGVDLNSPHIMDRFVQATQLQLSNKIDTIVADTVANYGTLAVINSGNIDTYDDAAEADALMLEQQATKGMRKMLLNPRMAKNLAGNLASRGTMTGAPMDAYTRSMLPPIGGFDTFRVDYAKTIEGSTGSGYVTSGTSNSYTPVSKDGNGIPVDNTKMTLTVATGTNAAVGDVFTITGVQAVGHINKQATGQLKTFRILEVTDATHWVISPAIIPADGASDAQKQYANVDTAPGNGSTINILNTTTKPCSIFFEESAIEIIHADFDVSAFQESGKKVRKATTDSGITIVMMSDSAIDTLSAQYRMFVWANAKLLNPELAGIMLEGQV